MQYRYAQIYKDSDGYGYVESDSYLSGIVTMDTMIPVAEGFDLTGKRWNYQTKKWEDYVPPVQPKPAEKENTVLNQLVADGKITEEEKASILKSIQS